MGSQETVDDRIADGYMNPGYAIWRELAAETVAASIDFRPAYTLSDIRGNIESDVHELHVGNPVAKVVMVNLLTDVIFSREFDAGKWTKTESTLREMVIPFIGTIEKVSTQLRRKTFYCITPEQDKTDKSRRCKSSAFPCKKRNFRAAGCAWQLYHEFVFGKYQNTFEWAGYASAEYRADGNAAWESL